jgi:hypothetical protein
MEGLRISIVDSWFNVRPSGATSGKWRIPDGKVGERSGIIFGAPKVGRWLDPEKQALIMY